MNEQYNDYIGDDQVYYSPSETDALVNDSKIMYKDLKEWLDECEAADAVFDSVIDPYYKGNPPPSKRITKKRPEYDAAMKEAKKIFDDTLEEIINYIIDYSNNSTLMIPQEVSAGSSNMITAERFEITDEVLTEEKVIIGEIAENENEVKK